MSVSNRKLLLLQVQGALARWDGTGSFVFTSSMSVCSTTDGSTVYENCPLVAVGAGPGTDRLLGAEKATLEVHLDSILNLVSYVTVHV